MSLNARHTYEETATALGMSVDTVRKVEIRALAKLRRDAKLRKIAREAGLLKNQIIEEAS